MAINVEQLAAVAGLQSQIDNAFTRGSAGSVSHTFRDFDPQTLEPYREAMDKIIEAAEQQSKAFRHTAQDSDLNSAAFLTQLNTKKIEGVLNFVQKAKNERHSALVNKAFAIFLAHDKSAQQLGLIPPALKVLREFQIFTPKKIEIEWEEQQAPSYSPSTTGLSHRPASNPSTADTLSGDDIIRYWRDDYDLNDHHYHWHQVYPWRGICKQDEDGNYLKNADGKHIYTRTIDRQGELFLYMHSQMLARYNAERISWNLGLVDPFTYDQVVEPSYIPPPTLRDKYGARPPLQGWLYTQPSSLPGDPDKYPGTTTNMTTWRNNINKAIINGYFITKKKAFSIIGSEESTLYAGKLPLKEENTMNWVGVVVEAEAKDLQQVDESSGEFIDGDLYGSLHNLGHDKFSMIGYQDYTGPTNSLGVMGYTDAAVRDPVFWIWHRHIDQFRQSVVQKYKHDDLEKFAPKNVELLSVKILPQSDKSSTPSGGISTYLSAPQLDLHEVNAKLQHEPYKWEIEVETQLSEEAITREPQQFTIRIFIVPKVLLHQQYHWIEMDKFKHTLSETKETITRLDIESSVARKPYKKGTSQECTCGWPQNMMLPNGTAKGMEYIAFAILTDKDELSQDTTQPISFCGAKDGKYPDKRGMGYPFDKSWYNDTTEFYEKIKHADRTVKVTDFKIYSETRFFQGKRVLIPKGVTWENTIKGYFSEKTKAVFDTEYNINVSDKDKVICYRMFIYHTIPLNEKDNDKDLNRRYGGDDNSNLDPWSSEQKDTFIGWIQAEYP